MNIKKHLPKLTRFNPFLMLFYAVVIGGGSYFIIMSRAATPPPNPPTMYLTATAPTTQTLPINTTFTVSVRENSGTAPVNGVQANITYPASLVDFVSIDSTTSAFGIEAQATGAAGQINIARGTSTTVSSVTGDQLVAILTFKTKTVGGSAALAFNAGTALVSSVTNQDILGSLSVTAGLTYVIDTTAPSVSMTSPLTGATLSGGSTVPIAITASDNSAVSSVDVYIDGILKTSLTTAPYTYNWSTTGLTLASHTIQAKANDAYGNTGSSSIISVTLADQTAPTVSITSPAAASTATGNVTINATAVDNTGGTGVNRVEFYVDGTLKSTDSTSPYSYIWDSKTVLDGTHSLTAKAFDNVTTPNTTTSTAVSVTVDNADHQAPTTPGGLSSTGNTLTAINLTWAASTDNVGVTGYRIQRNGTLIATVTTVAYTDTALASGSAFTYTVMAVDAAGNVSAPATLTASTLAIKQGDLNGDNSVNITDLSIFLSHWNTTDPVSDINHNGLVDIFDLSALLSHYGT